MRGPAVNRATALAAALALAAGGCDEERAPGVGVVVEPQVASVPRGGQQDFEAVVTGAGAPEVIWSLTQGLVAGTVDPTGLYAASDVPGVYEIVATEVRSGVSGRAAVTVTPSDCWALRAVDRVRVLPRAGHAAALVGGTIQGSNDSATNGFVTLATITQAPPEGSWVERTFANAVPYRWVKYYGPAGTTGSVAEVEFYSGGVRLAGATFGTTGTTGHEHPAALDGDPASYYEGTQTISNYVGLDAASDHLVGAPVATPAPGSYSAPQTISLSSPTSGAIIRYTTDGSDPTNGVRYERPFVVGTGSTRVRAVATRACMAASEETSGSYVVGSSGGVQAFLAIGNSLTDTLNGYMAPLATAGGVPLDYTRYTSPGIGTWIYEEAPTSGIGLPNVQTAVRTLVHHHLSFQPFPNMPCLPRGYASESLPRNRSDAVLIDRAWDDAVGTNPNVRMWVYEAWPPTPTEGFTNCITGGAWKRDATIWNPSSPATWEAAEQNELAYMEEVRAELVSMNPSRPAPYIVPAGRAVRLAKAAVEAGTVSGVATTAFWTTFFSNGGTDNHLTPIGRYLVTLVFYGALFQKDPRTLPDTNLGTPATVTAAQAAALQQIAYDAVSGYALSGYTR